MEFEVKENKIIEEGKHYGIIKTIEYRTEPFEYTDIFIDCEGIALKVGFPSIVSKSSSLGKFLEKFGGKLIVGQKIEPEKVLIGKKCVFLTMTEKTSKGEFARVIKDSVKPLIEKETESNLL